MADYFTPPEIMASGSAHHTAAAARNAAVADDASRELADVLSGASPVERILLKAAAGAGKSHVLKRLVAEAYAHPACKRAVVVAFTNKQVRPLAVSLGKLLGRDGVCLLVSAQQWGEVPQEVSDAATVVTRTSDIPDTACVIVATCSRLGAPNEISRLRDRLGAGNNGEAPFDVMFVDEAWQIPHHLFDRVTKAAPKWVAVGDVGQLPPLEIGENPWRGDAGYNPYRAWPTDYDDDAHTWARELPAVWRPSVGHLGLWRAFYPEWDRLDCVAALGDRVLNLGSMDGPITEIWGQVSTGVPTLLEVDGLPEPEAADIDGPLLEFVEALLGEFFSAGPSLETQEYGSDGTPIGTFAVARPGGDHENPLVAILATRNQAVDDAAEVVVRLREKYDLTERDIVSSTVDSYQGQTNGITVAIHPLNGAAELDTFNSAFGRLAVTCTRATHGLLMVARPGLDELLAQARARPGTPFGEPGNRQLPRQTHQRILATFARGRIDVSDDG